MDLDCLIEWIEINIEWFDKKFKLIIYLTMYLSLDKE